MGEAESSQRWTRSDKIGAATLVVTVLAALASYSVIPEVHQWWAPSGSPSSPDQATAESVQASQPDTPIPNQGAGQGPSAPTPQYPETHYPGIHSPGERTSTSPTANPSSVAMRPPLNPDKAAPNDATAIRSNEPLLHYILESDFDDEVLKQAMPVLVFFCVDYQDSCRTMTPIISSIAQERREKLKTVAIDVHINQNLPEKYDARSYQVPVTILFSEGTEKGRITGTASQKAVEHLIDNPLVFEKNKQARDQDPLEGITNVPESDFNDRVLRAGTPVLVYFFSPADASKQVSPLVWQVASDHKGEITVLKVDSYTESHLANEYDAGDYQTPLLILFKGGEARGLIKGTTSISTINHLIQRPEDFAFREDEIPSVSATLASIPDVHGTELDEKVKASSVPTFVYFYNRNDDPTCRAVARMIAAKARLYSGKVSFLKMDTSTAPDISYKYGSWDGPAIVLFKGPKVKDRKHGIISEDELTRMLEKALSAK